jgi:hypothetical protein
MTSHTASERQHRSVRRLLQLGQHLTTTPQQQPDSMGTPQVADTLQVASSAAAAAATLRGAPFTTYADLLATLKARGHTLREMGRTLDGSPLVVLKCGGEKMPAVFISGGAHSTEQAGVVACVELADDLVTEHAVYILPCRDPMGLDGFRHVLALGMGADGGSEEVAALQTTADAAAFLRENANVLHDQDGRLVATLGDSYAYSTYDASADPEFEFDERHPSSHESGMISTTDLPHLHEALRGRRVWWPSNFSNVECAAPLERAYTQFGPNAASPDEILHINRYHDTDWAPEEVQAARDIMVRKRVFCAISY